MNTRRAALSIIIFMVFFTQDLRSPAESSSPSAKLPKALHCMFDQGSFNVFENGKFASEPGGKMQFVIAAIDAKAGTAQMIGNAGAENLIMLRGKGNMNFVEQTGVGNINLTSVYTKVAPSGGFVAVHSRHVGTGDDPMISQYYGVCEGKW